MDFETGRGPEREERPPPEPGEEPRRASGQPSTADFNYTDPVQSFVNTVRDLVTQPVSFFNGIARQGDFVNPLVFALICVLVSVVIGGFLGLLGSLVGIGDRGFGAAFGALIGGIFLTPIFYAIGLFIGAGILHLLVALIIKPVNTNYETTFRVVSYSAVGQLVAWIPILGGIAAAVAGLVLAVIGVREMHNTTTGKAALVVLIPAAVVLLIGLILVALVGTALFFILQQ